MAIPDTEMARVEKALEAFRDRVPPHVRDKVWYDWRVRGNQVTLAEKRPAWWKGAAEGEITVHEFARFQYDPATHHWMLKWRDRNGRFHPYEGLERVRSFQRLVDEVDADPTGIFLG
ncbi:MAG: DUF3024 domain-containing protein [Longimicrobiales bacterium]|nr:DUF3024 domain-containing protein [Longimicrobiales bacterium]